MLRQDGVQQFFIRHVRRFLHGLGHFRMGPEVGFLFIFQFFGKYRMGEPVPSFRKTASPLDGSQHGREAGIFPDKSRRIGGCRRRQGRNHAIQGKIDAQKRLRVIQVQRPDPGKVILLEQPGPEECLRLLPKQLPVIHALGMDGLQKKLQRKVLQVVLCIFPDRGQKVFFLQTR